METKEYTQVLSIILIFLGSILLLIGFSADETIYYIFGVFSAIFGIIVYLKYDKLIYKRDLNQNINLSFVLLYGSILVFAGVNFVVAGKFVPDNIFTGMQLTPFSYVGLVSGSLASLFLSLLIYDYTFYLEEKNTSRVRKVILYISFSVYAFLAVIQFPAAVLYAGGYILMQILVLFIIYSIKIDINM